ncbi:MAG TPA: histidine phosphatase family protein [Firmicutes bacterium]|nr:histidine phosphatase family protein [Bacillota bacterium]
MTRLFLLRHGETKWNREEIFRGQSDIPLNGFGLRQAEALADTLSKADLKNPIFLSSPLKRAMKTAEIVASRFAEAFVTADPAFIDLSFGEWEGKTLREIEGNYPELYKKWVENPGRVTFPGGENLATVAERAEKGICRAAEDYRENEPVIVAHRAVNKALLCRLLGLGQQAFWKLRQDTACLNELAYEGSSFILVRLNDTCHLNAISIMKQENRDF